MIGTLYPSPAVVRAAIALCIASCPLSNALESDSRASNATLNVTSTEMQTATTMTTSYHTQNLTTTTFKTPTTTTSSHLFSTQTPTAATTSTSSSTQSPAAAPVNISSSTHTHATSTISSYSGTISNFSATSTTTYITSPFSSLSITSSNASSENMSSRDGTQTSRTRTLSSTSRSTSSISSSSSSRSTISITSTTSATTVTQTMTQTITTETVTVTHTVQLSGTIELLVTSARSFAESPQVEKSACRALAKIMSINVKFIEVTLQLKSKQMRLQSNPTQDVSQQPVELAYKVSIPFSSVEAESISEARMAIIQATPRQIARLLEVEVNRDSQTTYHVEVVEVFPPTLGSETHTAFPFDTTARGAVLADQDYSSAFRRTASLFASVMFSAAAGLFLS